MKTAVIPMVFAFASLSGLAHAQLSSTITAVSDYEFRGVSLTGTDPALQASLDYTFANGFAIGAWGSNLDYGRDYDGNFELDVYASFSRELSESAAWSAGFTAYTYPGSSNRAATAAQGERLKIEPYVEGYIDITLGSFHAAQWYTHDYSGLGVAAQYTEVNYSHALPQGWSVDAHLGYSWGDYFEDETMGGGELADYSVGVTLAAGHFSLAGKITATDASGERKVTQGPFTNDARFVLSIETTIPWSAAGD